MKSLLLEIGTEEIPARFIAGAVKSLKEGITKLLNDAHIDFEEISEYATPRRLAVLIKKISERQTERKIEVLGPPEKIAFDGKGNPTSAAAGFAKSQNIDIKKLRVVETDRGRYVAATIEGTSRETRDILTDTLPKLISSLQFPKSMRWGNGNLRFVRPIQWITAVLGSNIIPFEIHGLKSTDMTRGHRFLSPGVFRIKDPSTYPQSLSNCYVIADADKRREMISEDIKKIESSMDCIVHEDRELLDTVTFLVEYPTVILGNFDAEYLSLPKKLLITVMKNHQKYFSVEDKDGNLLPHFIVISNTTAENSETVRKGAERVIRARLEDARFYFNEDQKRPLWDYIEKLKDVTFQEKLGSVYEKVERIAFICSFLADVLSLPDKEKILRAAMLSKADLVTGIVREFPELQGYTGMIYARNSNEDEEVASAIHEHYMPRFSGDNLPSNEISSIISLADKMDNIACFFLVGLIPTGSEDPYGLRRQAMGIINILRNKDFDFSLDHLIDKALQGVESYLPARKTLSREILKFFYQRIEGIFLSEGYSHDIVNAVLSGRECDTNRFQPTAAAGGQSIKEIKKRVEILSRLKKEAAFPELLPAAKRVYNILSNTGHEELRQDLLLETAEQDLFNTVKKVKDKLLKTEYKTLFELIDPVNTFFDSVLVMDKDPAKKRNRFALLFSVKNIFDSLADFSKIM
ncbi:MAG: glycine--tRNA ligase subunit beta [Candidatus Mariimomonas ferrooxydans]